MNRLHWLRFVTISGACWLSAGAALGASDPTGALRCARGFAGPLPCDDVNQEARLSRAQMDVSGPYVRAVAGWADPASEREFALVSHADAVAVVEVTDPREPRLVGQLTPAGDGSVAEAAVFEHYAYVVVEPDGPEASLEIFDLTAVLDPGGEDHFHPAATLALADRRRIAIDGEAGRAYLYNRTFGPPGGPPSTIAVYDLAVPLAPSLRFLWGVAGGLQGLECFTYHGPASALTGHPLCATAGFPKHLRLYDLTEDSPRRLGSATYGQARWPWRVAVTADHRFVLLADSHDEHFFRTNTRTFVFDIRDPENPVPWTRADGATKTRDLDLAVRGKFAYLAAGRDGLRVFDLRQLGKRKIKEFGGFDIDPESQATDWFGAIEVDVLPSGLVLLIDSREGLYVLRPVLPGP